MPKASVHVPGNATERADVTPAERARLHGSSRRYFRALADSLELADRPVEARRARQLAAASPLVSVVMAVLDDIDLAARAIRSALAQTYDNIEIIVVVDKSASHFDKLAALATEHPNVCVVRDDGRGAGAAKNLGIDMAMGEYIAFLDHDDCFMPTKIAQQVERMIEEGYLVSHTSYLAIYPARNLGPAIVHSGMQSGMLFPSIMSNCPIAATTAMFHRAIAAAGFRYSEDFDLGADTLLWATIGREYPILGIDVPLTLIEWSDDTAALCLRKQRLGLKALREAYNVDPIFRDFPSEIQKIEAALALTDAELKAANADPGAVALNTDIIVEAFGRA